MSDPTEESSYSSAHPFAPQVILYVEDDIGFRSVMTEVITRALPSFRILAASSLEEGIAFAKTHGGSLVAVISDGFLTPDLCPNTTAVQLMEGIDQELQKRLPFIVLTGDIRHFPAASFPRPPLCVREKGGPNGIRGILQILTGMLYRGEDAPLVAH